MIDADRERFADSLRRALPPGGVQLLLLPAVIGELGWLEQALSVRCAELPSLLPSLPGLRLQRALDRQLEAAGVRLLLGDAFSTDGRIAGLRLRDPVPPLPESQDFDEGAARQPSPQPPSWPLRAGAVVLATGKFIGGGIERRGRLREPIFDLPVWLDGRVDEGRWMGDVTDAELEAEQAAFRAGLRIDGRLRPLDRGGRPVDDELFACGALLYGNDAARDGAGLGLAWFSGWLAGLEAAGGG
jgi:glycerol-3-phosphate dehydrogenase subunit B